MKKYFTIHENDAGSEAYDSQYVLSLERDIERMKTTGAAALLADQGKTERLVACGKAAIEALGLDDESDSPDDVKWAVGRLVEYYAD